MKSLLAAAALLLSGCVAGASPPATIANVERRPPVTILVSIDGLRPDSLGRGDTPVLDVLATAGAAGAMRPSFPANTFPNHYTLVTGLRPDRHGVVDNTMEDPARPGVRFTIGDPKQNRDRFWWEGAEPIWVTAERAGIRAGTMFWPGTEAAIGGVRPSVWVPYVADIGSAERVRFVLDWLRRPETERPRLLTLYFDQVDKAAHEQGYGSPEQTEATREIDAQIGVLRDGLAALGQPANLVVVSDHGMAPVPPTHLIDPADIADEAIMRTAQGGPILYAWPKPGAEAAVAARVLRPRAHLRCWRRGELPARFRFGRHPRVPPFLCMADLGWRFAVPGGRAYLKGEHGYDPAEPSMRAIFIANGPAFRPGRRVAEFDNVSVAPLLRRLIGLPPAPGLDGTAAPFNKVLR
ncbi:MAG TPA: ectonucleotide pyrophosphatase/phosphodiesterase [Sphingomonas sp.]|jgi:predicted AlkP superfamily pyrophosphatase or phosphodiesterase|uniref:alkaline phosphatase family protein n=1 Tax=Sphingomonas sp. TaxID=28214 RepID=UPI002ED83D58